MCIDTQFQARTHRFERHFFLVAVIDKVELCDTRGSFPLAQTHDFRTIPLIVVGEQSRTHVAYVNILEREKEEAEAKDEVEQE